MKSLIIAFLILPHLAYSVDWKNPDLICPEQAVARGLPCPDLTTVRNPSEDFPTEMQPEEIRIWKTQNAVDLRVCRAKELLRREALQPGSFGALPVQIAWMHASAGNSSQEKYKAMVEASTKYNIPIHVLIGALTQESLLSDLGISPDGGNFSCGIGQLNVIEWCNGMKTLSPAEQEKLGWPAISCESKLVTPAMVGPFYDLALKKLDGRPAYQIDAKDFKGITIADVAHRLPRQSAALRFKALSSFINNCQNFELGIRIKAQNLRLLFDRHVPAKMKTSELYSEGEGFKQTCEQKNTSRYYPLHTGWLMTLAIYNAGATMVDLLGHYHQTTSDKLPALTPPDLVEALYWGGKYNPANGRIYFKKYSHTATKSCVVQRHVARAVQHVSRPGNPLLRSLEEIPCAQGVSERRKTSSGVRK